MFRPPTRSNNRFVGDAAAQDGVTTLSAAMKELPYSSPDGRKLRRRWAMAGAACLLVLAVIIGVTVSKNNNESDTNNGQMSSTSSTSKGSSSSNNPADLTYPIPQTPTAAFELVTSETMEDLQLSVTIFKHTKSGMRVLAMIPKDPNQDATFGINFRTPPEQSDGAQFVVQNAVLQGSVNYPVKDPFHHVAQGSLQTYWSSWTNRDRTSFVVASRNLADYGNNLKVMIDAVFHPLFVKNDYKWIYRQEGWRLEAPDNDHLAING